MENALSVGSNANKIAEQYETDALHVLIPQVYLQQINPFYSFVAIPVKADLSENSGDIFKVGTVKVKNDYVDTYSPCKPFLERLAAAAGISFNSRNTYCTREGENIYKGHAEAAIRMADGFPRLLTDEKLIDMDVVEKQTRLSQAKKLESGLNGYEGKQVQNLFNGEWRKIEGKNYYFIDHSETQRFIDCMTDKAMVQLRKDAPQKAVTGACTRVIRAALGMKGSYTLEELRKPFIITRLNFTPDYNDPMVKNMALSRAFAAAGDLYGNSVPVNTFDSAQTVQTRNDKPVVTAAAEQSKASVPEQPQPVFDNTEPDTDDVPEKYYCKDCGQEIIPKDGWTVARMKEFSLQWFGRELCSNCMKAEMSKTSENQQDKKRENSSGKQYGDEVCSECGHKISPKCSDYSKSHYGRPLCYNCGQKVLR